ncbi:MAG: type I restriction enzyme HsdR N-terminal domain-containing protein [Balneolaceae bacterium]|nr:type I restriction enzyme HsdR N-terminal domain-containing protein [Balneolaceae bacterium]
MSDGNLYRLYNPILRKRYKNRPEERVRLCWTEFLLHQTGVSRTRIGFETPVQLRQVEKDLRADLVIYTDTLKPKILIECKSESVRLTGETAEQAARYNRKLGASQLVLTNGVEDLWFDYENGLIQESENRLEPIADFERPISYWQKRGFCSSVISQNMREWYKRLLKTFWSREQSRKIRYLDFKESPLQVPMNHYYRVFEPDPDNRLAVTFAGIGESGNFLIALLNKKGVNQGLFWADLNRAVKNPGYAATIMTSGRQKEVPAFTALPFSFSEKEQFDSDKLVRCIMKSFD